MTQPTTNAPPIPCHEDPRLGEQDVTQVDIAAHPGRESALALLMQEQPEPVLGPLSATLGKAAFFPPANRTAQFYGNSMSAVDFSFVRLVCWHSTETSGMPGYQGGASAPNLTCYPDYAAKKVLWRHHWRLNQSSRSLVHPPGVQTNNSNVVQIEQVGTSAKGGPGMYLPEAPDWYLEGIAEFMQFMRDQWGVPLVSTVTWKDYPASYGVNNGVRLAASPWLAYHGHLAHQHVYGNDHGDVKIAIAKALKMAGGSTPPKPPQPPTNVPAFPLSSGAFFGNGGVLRGHNLKLWQGQMAKRGWKITADDVYGPQTKAIALAFQKEKGLVADSLIGRQTWDAAWTSKIT